MKKKKLISLVLACTFVMSTLLSGCVSNNTDDSKEDSTKTEKQKETKTGSKDENATMTRAESGDISAIIPIGQNSADAQEMVLPIFDMLYRVSGQETKYYLAESFKMSEDNKELTVKLKDGLKYHDGEKINADELIWNFNVRKEQKLDAYFTASNNKEVAIEKVDDLTVKLTLQEPSASYAAIFGMIQMIPSHMYKDASDILNCDANEKGIGTGPYKVKEWNKGESFVLERNEDYYGEKAGIKTLVFKIIPDQANQAVSFESGDLDVLTVRNQADYDKYSKMDGVQMFSFPEGRNHYLAFNALSENMKEDKARQAICAALDQNELVTGAYGGSAVAKNANNVFTEATLYYSDAVTGYKHDADQAKELIKETGLDGKVLKIIYNSDRANFEDIALIVQQQLKEVGIESEIQGYDANSYFDQLFEYDGNDTGYDIAVNGYASNGDPDAIKGMFSSLSHNMFTSDKLEELWKQGMIESDAQKRQEIYEDAAKEIYDLHAMYMVGSTNIILAAKEGYKGLDKEHLIPLFVDYSQIYKEVE